MTPFSKKNYSDRVRAARFAILHIKTENRALFRWNMRDFRIYTFWPS